MFLYQIEHEFGNRRTKYNPYCSDISKIIREFFATQYELACCLGEFGIRPKMSNAEYYGVENGKMAVLDSETYIF